MPWSCRWNIQLQQRPMHRLQIMQQQRRQKVSHRSMKVYINRNYAIVLVIRFLLTTYHVAVVMMMIISIIFGDTRRNSGSTLSHVQQQHRQCSITTTTSSTLFWSTAFVPSSRLLRNNNNNSNNRRVRRRRRHQMLHTVHQQKRQQLHVLLMRRQGHRKLVPSTLESRTDDNDGLETDLTNEINKHRPFEVVPPLSSSSSSSSSLVPFRYHHLTNIKRIFCLSDLHTDHGDNLQWLRDHVVTAAAAATTTFSSSSSKRCVVQLQATDLVIIAGDISHQISTFNKTMSIFVQQQCHVVFVPGNHEAWIQSSTTTKHIGNDNDNECNESSNDKIKATPSSLDKLKHINDLCRTMGVYVDPVYISCNDTTKQHNPVWILPLQSWYDGSLSFDETLCEGFEKWPWMDFIKCQWDTQRFPSMSKPNSRIPKGLVEYFLQQNQRNVIEPFQRLVRYEEPALLAPVITVSHFAPNQQCLPDWNDLGATQFNVKEWLDHGAATMSAKFAKVAGTQLLDDQIRTILLPLVYNSSSTGSKNNSNLPLENNQHMHIHIFGHSHRPKDFIYRNIRYIHNPLGKPRERQLRMISPDVTFQHIWNVVPPLPGVAHDDDDDNIQQRSGEVVGPTITRYWEQYGGGIEMLRSRMNGSVTTPTLLSPISVNGSNNNNDNTTDSGTIEIQGGRYREQQQQPSVT